LPLTPFHMGAALIVKPGFDRHFSVLTFGVAQVVMDIEPGIGMLTGAEVLHGPSHTVLGAIAIGFLVMLMAPGIGRVLLKKWNREVIHHKLPARLLQPEIVPRMAVLTGAFFGSLSHLALDSLIHHDIHPLRPFSNANPLLGLMSHDAVYQLCVVAGVLGGLLWVALNWVDRSR